MPRTKKNEPSRPYLTREDRAEYLTWVVTAKTDIMTVGGKIVEVYVHEDGRKEIITNADRQRAIAELNKMGDV